VHIVHCIDTEGPLHEPVEATFERINEIFELDLPPSMETLRSLQRSELDLGGIEAEVAKVISPELLSYNDTWAQIDTMLDEIASPEYRAAMPDSDGGSWVYNWHCLDFVGFATNPRRRDEGYHRVFDHYREMIRRTDARDGLHFHHHPIPFSGEGHHSTTHYFSHSPMVFQILARRIIERQWFPCANRPGFHTTRPDSHWLMEQFIPFDYANQATDSDDSAQKDLPAGRFGDWRRAPKHWRPYHPDYDDYQIEGSSRRWIGRCLNIGSRVRVLTDADARSAFAEAQGGAPVVLSFTHHDFRDMRPAIEDVRKQIAKASAEFPDVRFKYCEGREAMRLALSLPARDPVKLIITLDETRLAVDADAATYGPQPFLALKTRDGRYFHDNFDFQEPFRSWSYHLDEQSIPVGNIETIGVATCNSYGDVTVANFDPASGQVTSTYL